MTVMLESRLRPPRVLLALALAPALAVLVPSAVFAAWSTQGQGAAAGAALQMPAGSAPTASVSGAGVTVSWPAATYPGGAASAGYQVDRFNAATGAPAAVGTGCSGVVGATTCTEQNVPAGTWSYTDTPMQGSWAGGQSPQSAPVVVGGRASRARHPRRVQPRPRRGPTTTTAGPTTTVGANGA